MATRYSMEENTFTQGNLFEDEGFATYAKTTRGEWASIDGEPGKITKVKEKITDPEKIKKLEGLIKTFQGPARYFGKK